MLLQRRPVGLGDGVGIEQLSGALSGTGLTAAYAAGTMAIMVPDILPPTPEVRANCLTVLRDLHAALRLLQAHL